LNENTPIVGLSADVIMNNGLFGFIDNSPLGLCLSLH
jgi:hypothetical protein